MAGVLFIINVPQKKYESELRKKEKFENLLPNKQKDENASPLSNKSKNNSYSNSGSFKLNLRTNDKECRSSNHLQAPDPDGLLRTKSESKLDDVSFVSEGRRRKSSWEDVRHVLSPWTKRVTVDISQPRRSVDIAGAFHVDTPLETILLEILTRLDIKSAAWNSTRDNSFWKVIFSLESGNLNEELLQVLRTFGIGSRFQSSISVIPSALYYKSDQQKPDETKGDYNLFANRETRRNSAWSRFSSSIKARHNLEKVLHDVRADAALTFDWLFLLVIAAFVAALGLVENSTVILVASMLISPLMGPITAGTLGVAVRDKNLQYRGLLSEILGLILALIIGFIYGLGICVFTDHYGTGDWPTYEMTSRGEMRSLWVGVLVAIPSGAAVALAVLGDKTASLVGVAISVSLLPPAVNSGLLWAMALTRIIKDQTRWVTTSFYSGDQATELALLGTVSLCLTFVNIVCIIATSVIIYKVKEVHPLERKDIAWWKVNQELMNAWNMYNDWSSRNGFTGEKSANLLSPSDIDGGPSPNFRRVRAKSIEIYCRRQQRIPDFFTLDEENDENRNTDENEPSNENNENHTKSMTSLEETSTISVCDSSLSDSETYHNNNKDKHDSKLKNNVKERPTLEPSSNYTVDAKNKPVLGTKSYHV